MPQIEEVVMMQPLCRAAAVKGSSQIDRHHLPPVRGGKIGQKPLPRNPGVADQHIDVSKLLLHRLHHPLHLLRVGNIRLHRNDRAAFPLHLCGKLFDLLLRPAIICRHLIARARKSFRCCPADAARGAGDQRHLRHPDSSFVAIKRKNRMICRSAGMIIRIF